MKSSLARSGSIFDFIGPPSFWLFKSFAKRDRRLSSGNDGFREEVNEGRGGNRRSRLKPRIEDRLEGRPVGFLEVEGRRTSVKRRRVERKRDKNWKMV